MQPDSDSNESVNMMALLRFIALYVHAFPLWLPENQQGGIPLMWHVAFCSGLMALSCGRTELYLCMQSLLEWA